MGGRGLGGSQWDGKTQSLELQGWALPHLSPCFTVPPSPLTLQMRPQKHKVKMLCQIQADGTSAPEASTSLWAAPRLASPPPGPLSGLSLQGGAIQTWERGSCWHHPHPLGWGAGWGREWSLETGLQAWPSITPGCPSGLRGSELEGGIETSQCIQSLLWRPWGVRYGRMSTGLGVLSPSFYNLGSAL